MELSQKQKQKIEEVAKKYRLKLVLLFGSRVEGKIHKESDYDVAYLPSKKLSFDDEVKINYYFTIIFPQERFRVDTVDLRKASPLFLAMIFKKCQVLFQEDNLIFPTYKIYAYKKYIEAKPSYEKRFKKLRKRIKRL